MQTIPELRLRTVNQAPLRPEGRYVLYWMTAFRRLEWNFSLQRALAEAERLGKPLVVLEALRCGYPWASDRLHRFVIAGMADNLRTAREAGLAYLPYLEPEAGAGRGLLEALAADAALVVTDDFPCFFLPRMLAAAAQKLSVRLEAVDANGLLPLRAASYAFTRAFSLRGFLQQKLPHHLDQLPLPRPLEAARLPAPATLPKAITRRWPAATPEQLEHPEELLARLPIDHDVAPVTEIPGGPAAAQAVLRRFLERRLPRYGEDRNHPDEDGTSGLSPYLHFGHISVHQVFHDLARAQSWTPARLGGAGRRGSREGWWGMSPEAEGFLDELITWRELGYNQCWFDRGYDRYESLPAWAQATLAEHAGDPRDYLYDLADFEAAATHDPLWNAAQRQLVREGRIHNYLRMLWGKKILEWTPSPREALAVMIELNNKYALDGRNPNSYSGIFWVLGRYDRAWGPERPVFGKIRFMSSDNTRRKLRVERYLQRYGR